MDRHLRALLCARYVVVGALWVVRVTNALTWGSFLYLAGAGRYFPLLVWLGLALSLTQGIAYRLMVALAFRYLREKQAKEIFK